MVHKSSLGKLTRAFWVAMTDGQLCHMFLHCVQADAPVSVGYGINYYGGPVLSSKAGFVVRLCSPVPYHPWQPPGCRPGVLARMVGEIIPALMARL